MNERGVEDDPKQLVMSEEDEIEHTLGPNVSNLTTHRYLNLTHHVLQSFAT